MVRLPRPQKKSANEEHLIGHVSTASVNLDPGHPYGLLKVRNSPYHAYLAYHNFSYRLRPFQFVVILSNSLQFTVITTTLTHSIYFSLTAPDLTIPLPLPYPHDTTLTSSSGLMTVLLP